MRRYWRVLFPRLYSIFPWHIAGRSLAEIYTRLIKDRVQTGVDGGEKWGDSSCLEVGAHEALIKVSMRPVNSEKLYFAYLHPPII